MKHNLMRGAFYITLSQVAMVFSNYLIHFGLARYFGPSAYGNFGVILSLMFITRTIFMTGLHRAVAKYASEYKNRARSVLKEGIKLQIIFVLFIFLIYLLFSKRIAGIFNDFSLNTLILFSAITFLPTGLYNVSAKGYLNGKREFKLQAIAESFNSIIKLISAFVLVYFGFGLFGAISAYAVAPLFSFGLILFILRKKIFKKIEYKFDIKKLFKFALPLSFFYVIITISMELGLLSVKSMLLDDNLTGFYTSASTLAKIILSLFTALPLTILPSISSAIVDNNLILVKNYINKSLRYSIMILFPITALISSHSEQLISILYSSSFVVAAPTLKILVFGFMFIAVFMLQSSFLSGAGKPIIQTIISTIILVIMYLLNLFLIPNYGMVGAAISTTIAAFVGLVISSMFNLIHFKTLMEIKSLVKITLASLIIYFFGYFWSMQGFGFIISFGLLFLLYLCILVLFKEITKEDKDLLISSSNINKIKWLNK